MASTALTATRVEVIVTAPIEDASSLPGRKVSDQQEIEVGKVTEIYTMESGFPMWVVVQTKAGIGPGPRVFIPLARLKEENGELRVPYSKGAHPGSPRGRRRRPYLRGVRPRAPHLLRHRRR